MKSGRFFISDAVIESYSQLHNRSANFDLQLDKLKVVHFTPNDFQMRLHS
jgi:hypothetical protein